ncbi:MAG: hypothetical protein ABW119_23055, partial [Candidatus Thiodiazotropha lotti]
SCIFALWRPLLGQVNTNPTDPAALSFAHPAGLHHAHPAWLNTQQPQLDCPADGLQLSIHSHSMFGVRPAHRHGVIGVTRYGCIRTELLSSFIEVLVQRITNQQYLSISSRIIGISKNVLHHHQPGSCLRNL